VIECALAGFGLAVAVGAASKMRLGVGTRFNQQRPRGTALEPKLFFHLRTPVFIIVDEAQELTAERQQSRLKTLRSPPELTLVLCTTRRACRFAHTALPFADFCFSDPP
jgi:hypothetical protein